MIDTKYLSPWIAGACPGIWFGSNTVALWYRVSPDGLQYLQVLHNHYNLYSIQSEWSIIQIEDAKDIWNRLQESDYSTLSIEN
jgi:hypothetical protein